MGRILGIDYGTKRIGLAVTDPLQIFATPLITIKNHEFDDFLKKYADSESIEEFVIGYPAKLNNQSSETVKYVNLFVRKIKKSFPGIPVHLEDERFTSEMAYKTIIQGGVRKKGRKDKSLVDKISAAIILQSFLDKRQKTDRKR